MIYDGGNDNGGDEDDDRPSVVAGDGDYAMIMLVTVLRRALTRRAGDLRPPLNRNSISRLPHGKTMKYWPEGTATSPSI